ncbi:MAG TPA: T9SS type A sorting domain-containing protein, partial [Pseudobacter sp.]|nr:T9SS type A sorting domain-containing protein [Pseudobacter sp.]
VRQTDAAANRAEIFANTNIATTPYPAGIPGVFTFTGNVQRHSGTGADEPKYWYFFYDTKLRFLNCPSAGKNEVTASSVVPPTITLAGNVLTSSSATGNQWYRNGTEITGATDKTYTATTAGTYTTVVRTEFNCALTSNEINAAVTSSPNVDPVAIGLKILPNPSNGRFVADFTVTKKADLNIAILNTLGQKVFENNYPGFIGRFNKTVEAAHLTTGVYMLRIQHDNKNYLTKLIIR